MNLRSRLLICIALLLAIAMASQAEDMRLPSSDVRLEYLKAVNQLQANTDPELVLLLMTQFISNSAVRDGIVYYEDLLQRFAHNATPAQRALYMANLGLLRALHADDVFLLRRIGWVRDTITLLDDAVRLSGGQSFVIRWIRGSVYARLPALFDQRQTAFDDLSWCESHPALAPHQGWMREVFFQLARLQRDWHHDEAAAAVNLNRSGYKSLEQTETLTTPFSNDEQTGHTFSAKRIREIVPGRVFALSGFEFTEYYFVVSDDGSQLIGIDAGTRPDSAKQAYEALQSAYANLPPLKTIFVTHAHWDHIGGHHYFRALASAPRIFARANYDAELQRSLAAPTGHPYFFGRKFSQDDIRDFHPDVLIDGNTEIKPGGTRVQLIPIQGGETDDGMFIYLPGLAVLFVGDFAMPYFGAPFVNEGNVNGFVAAVAKAAALAPRHILHGHQPLTRIFNDVGTLQQTARQVGWLQMQITDLIRKGLSREEIHARNLIPPDLVATPKAQLPLLLMRENLIDRLYAQKAGYWGQGLAGLDALTDKQLGAVFSDYLHLTDLQLAAVIEKMLNRGDLELAARVVTQSIAQFPQSNALVQARRNVFSRLRQKYQEFDPFRFIIYSEAMDAPVQMLKGAP